MAKSTPIDIFLKRVTEYGWLFGFTLLVSLVVNLRYFFFVRSFPYPGEAVFSSISSLFWATLFTVLVALLPWSWLRKAMVGIVVLISFIYFIFEHYLLSAYKTVFTDSIAVNILATNPDEAKEFTAIIPASFLLTPFLVALGLFILCYVFRGAIASSIDKLLPQKRVLRFSLVLSPIILACCTSIPAQIKLYYNGTPSFAYMTPYDRIPQGTLTCIRQGEEVMRYFDRIQSIDVGEIKQSKDLGRVNVLLIMGESLRRDYMGCYGYQPNTTPRLDSMIRIGDILMFNDVVAPAPSTVSSILENLTFHRLDAQEKQEDFSALIPVLSRAGYYTYWVSNQEKQGAYIQPLAGLAETADSTKYIKIRTSTDWGASYDGDIIPHTLELDKHSGSKSIFQLVHIMGSHSGFGDRYPKQFHHFTAKDLPKLTAEGNERPQGEVEDKNLVEYLNSIYYNDFVITELIKKHQNERTIVIYLADHGVEVHDNPENPEHCGHPTSARGLKIPLMVYFSPEMRRDFPDLWEEIATARNNKIMTDLLSHSVCNLLGVESKYSDEKLSFFSPKYDNTRRRMVSAFGTVVEM